MIRADGKIGFGIGSPEAPLHIQIGNSATPTNLLILEAARNIQDTEIGILFKDRSAIATGQNVSRIWTDRQGSTGNFDLVFQAGDQGAGGLQPSGMRIQGDTGNVGIGTTSPQQTLNVVGNLNVSGSLSVNSYISSASIINKIVNSAGAFTVRNNSNNDLLYVKHDGNVGIGTPNPEELLHVAGDSLFTGKLEIKSNSYPSMGFMNLADPDDEAGFYYDVANTYGFAGSFLFLDNYGLARGLVINYEGGTPVLIADAQLGRVGIGTATPTHELNVVGNGNFTGNVTIGSLRTIKSNITCVIIKGKVSTLEIC